LQLVTSSSGKTGSALGKQIRICPDDLRIKVDMSQPTSEFCSKELEHFKSYILFDLQWLNYKSYFTFSEVSKIIFFKSEYLASKYRLKFYSFEKRTLCLNSRYAVLPLFLTEQ